MSAVPASLKAVAPYVQKGKEMEKLDPVVSYYCYYHAIQLIISNGLHNVDEESKAYSMTMMDVVEQTRTALGDREEVQDSVVGQAYLEEFALRILNNAERDVQAGKAAKKTAVTLRAAAIFMEVSQLADELDPEMGGRIKYAKFHAARILKSLSLGEDPNAKQADADATPPETADDIEDLQKSDSMQHVIHPPNHGSSEDAGPSVPVVAPSNTSSPGREDAFSGLPPTIPPPAATTPFAAPDLSRSTAPPPTLPRPGKTPFNIAATHSTYNSQEDYSQTFTAAQRHAKFAISALNYEDVVTARRELQLAMDKLSTL